MKWRKFFTGALLAPTLVFAAEPWQKVADIPLNRTFSVIGRWESQELPQDKTKVVKILHSAAPEASAVMLWHENRSLDARLLPDHEYRVIFEASSVPDCKLTFGTTFLNNPFRFLGKIDAQLTEKPQILQYTFRTGTQKEKLRFCNAMLGKLPAGTVLRVGKLQLQSRTMPALAEAENPADAVEISGTPDRPDGVYKTGETIRFTFKVTDFAGKLDRNSRVAWKLGGDHSIKTGGIINTATDNPFTVECKAKAPGFVTASAELIGPDGKARKNIINRKVESAASAVIEPEKLTAFEPAPSDFDAYWAKRKAELGKIPVTVIEKRHIGTRNGKSDLYAVKIACIGKRPVTGILAVPVHAKPKSLPARANFYGYGVQDVFNPAETDCIIFNIGAHGLEVRQPAKYYQELAKGELKNYGFSGNQTPEQSYFDGMLLRDLRAVQFLQTLPEWNGRDLIVAGGSQGGFQALAVAALEPKVTRCEAAIPWLCNVGAFKKDCRGGWTPKYENGLRYFTPVNFAKSVRAQVEITAGFSDDVCPGAGIMALYHALPGKKKIDFKQGMGHGGGYGPFYTEHLIFESK